MASTDEDETSRLRACAVPAGSLKGVTPIRFSPALPRSVTDAYLARLQVPNPVEPTPSALHELTAAHLERIAYDNIDTISPLGIIFFIFVYINPKRILEISFFY